MDEKEKKAKHVIESIQDHPLISRLIPKDIEIVRGALTTVYECGTALAFATIINWADILNHDMWDEDIRENATETPLRILKDLYPYAFHVESSPLGQFFGLA